MSTDSKHCEEILAQVCDALDGAPLAVDLRQIDEHLARCDSCREMAARLRADDAALKALGRTRDAKDLLPADGPLVQGLAQRLQALQTFLPGNVHDRELSDEDLQWLSAAGTAVPPLMPAPPGSPDKKPL